MRFRQWAHKGVTAYCTTAKARGLESFGHLSNAYNLGKNDFFRYPQVRDYFNKEIKQTEDNEPNLINIFTDAYKSKDNKHLISRIYKRLQNCNNYSTDYVKQKWEKESGLQISEDDWNDIHYKHVF